ncbi:MAG: preprotein translocase subunit YajC [Cyclobacteriaceae bacterium]|nr:preprotein translocase subunit YajC [Cyclobacteriaceae bacterium]
MFVILLQSTPGQSGAWSQIILMAAIIGIFYFFMIRPQQKKAKEERKFRDEVKKGDLVVTIGGAHGRIVEMEDDTVVLEFERGVRIRFSKSSISMESSKRANAVTKTPA